MGDRPAEFWEEEQAREKEMIRRVVIRWLVVLLALLVILGFALWRSTSAVHFGASRVREDTIATYRVFGTVRDSITGQAVAWATVGDDESGRGPHRRATADLYGNYELMTIAEPHRIIFHANGYKPASAQVGKNWYLWMPSGEQAVDIALEPEQ